MDLCLKFGALTLAVSCSQAALLAQSTTLSCRPLDPGNNFIYPDERVVGNQAWKIVQNPTVPEKQAVLRATVTPAVDAQPAPAWGELPAAARIRTRANGLTQWLARMVL